ncbi:MAG: hypothetical protein K9H49_08085 [Bacteroidales bacterium]|nr:hypothetical protein [Bacteroidales bacterium]MCF8391365.1 hypothetical protein [Bacteroidales bacterium]
MDTILEIIKYTLPALIVLLASYSMIKMFLRNEDKKRRFEFGMNQKDSVLPLRLQAYERLILLLERLSPDVLVMRLNSANLTVSQMQNELISAIRTEFDHNLAQQTYISIAAWEKIKSAKTEMVKLINMSASEINPKENATVLSKRIIENAIELGHSPTSSAINFLKEEVKELF